MNRLMHGSYILHLVCAVEHDDSHAEFTGDDRVDAFRKARESGWSIVWDYPFCPLCVEAATKARLLTADEHTRRWLNNVETRP